MKKINTFLALALCVLLSTGMAFADNDKTPPGSGINPGGQSGRPGFDNGNAWWKNGGGDDDNGGGTPGGPPPKNNCPDCQLVVVGQGAAALAKINLSNEDVQINSFAGGVELGGAAFLDCDKNVVERKVPSKKDYGYDAEEGAVTFGGVIGKTTYTPIVDENENVTGLENTAGAVVFTKSFVPAGDSDRLGYQDKKDFSIVGGAGLAASGTGITLTDVAKAQSVGAAGYLFVGQQSGSGVAGTYGHSSINLLPNGGISVQASQISGAAASVK